MWAEAVNYVVYTLNRTGTSSKKEISPSELWLKRKPKLTNLKIFGEVYFHIPKERRRKWDVKAEKGFFVGYGENTKSYRVWLSERDQVKIYRDVAFTGQQYKHHLAEQKSTEPKISFNYSIKDAITPSEEEPRSVQMQDPPQDNNDDSDAEDNLQICSRAKGRAE